MKRERARDTKTPQASPRPLLLLLSLLAVLLVGCAASPPASPRVPLDVTATNTSLPVPLETAPRAADLPDPEDASSGFRLDPATLEVNASSRSHQRNWSRNIFHATFGVTTFQSVMVVAMTQLPPEVTGWTGREPGFTNISRSFTLGPRFDDDAWYWNAIAHPLAGAEYYLLARNRGAAGWQALLYAAALSAFFEFGPEAAYERASIQDLIITPIGGAILGECRYQARKALIDPRTGKANATWKQVLVVILDPIEALTE